MAFLMCTSLCATARADVDPKAAARVHFQKGVTAFEARRYREAAEEFETAYELSPAFVVLYNIGQVNVALGNSVQAVAAFTEYLKQGASSIPEERRREVETEIEDQLARIGTLVVRSTPDGAEIRVDGRLVGTTPWGEEIRLNAGRHTIQALLDGHSAQVRELDVVGKAQLELSFTFERDIPSASGAGPQGVQATPPPRPVPTTAASRRRGSGKAIKPSQSPQRQPSAPINWLRLTGYGVALGGVALGTIGGLKVFNGINQAEDARRRMSDAQTPADYDAALPDYESGKETTESGWAIAGVGVGVLLGGALLVLAAPDPQASAMGIGFWVTADAGGMNFGGAW